MSSHVVVISTDLRRATVKVNPGTYLIDVLQEACKKLNLSADKYIVKHKQRTVDLSVPFRTSGLLGGAKLELVQKSKTPSAVQVALQVPLPEGKEIPGGRLIQKFPSDLTLWKLLRQFESGSASGGRNINVTARGVAQMAGGGVSGSGQMYYETPVLNIMGREFDKLTDFQKTLSQLGYNSGSVLIRLSFKLTGDTLFEAMEQISQFFKEEDEEENPVAATEESKAADNTASDAVQDTTMTDAENESAKEDASQPTLQEETTAPDAGPGTTEIENNISGKKDLYAPVNVFLAPSGTVPAAALAPLEEVDYQPTIAHAQLHQARLQESSRNKRLLSDKEIADKAAAEEAKLAAVKSVLVKVRFPDNSSSEWQVGPVETGAFLYEAVRHVMASNEQPFHLVLPGDRTVIKDDSGAKHCLIKGYKLSGRVLVNLVWEDSVTSEVRQQAFLKANVASQGQEVKVPDLPDVAYRESPPAPEYKEEKKSSGDGVAKKIPKWLKLGKK